MEQTYDKLVRDNIPERIIKNGGEPFYRILNGEEYWSYLLKKDLEELEEVRKAKTEKEILEELADKLELIRAMGAFHNFNLDDIIKAADIKKINNGGFQKRILLEKVIENKKNNKAKK